MILPGPLWACWAISLDVPFLTLFYSIRSENVFRSKRFEVVEVILPLFSMSISSTFMCLGQYCLFFIIADPKTCLFLISISAFRTQEPLYIITMVPVALRHLVSRNILPKLLSCLQLSWCQTIFHIVCNRFYGNYCLVTIVFLDKP